MQRSNIGTERVLPLCSLDRVASIDRSFVLGSRMVAAIEAGGAILRKAVARYRRRQQAKAIRDELYQLDDRTLRDFGVTRGEIASFAAEITGQAERTRARVPDSMRP